MNARVPLAAVLTTAALALLSACKGDQGPPGPPGPAGDAGPGGATVIVLPSNSQPPTDAASAAWAALQPQISVQSVTISSPPRVSFTVTDAAGHGLVGVGNTSQSSTATVPGLTNLSFALAKLVPGASGSPSKWVSYIVTTVPTTTAAAAPSRPSTDNTGTLEDHGDGTYTYTFYRDVTQIKAQVDGMTVSGSNNKADLGDLTYDPSLVHRLTIQLSGSAPGTGSNTPNGATNVPGVSLQRPVDFIYDFDPRTGQAVASSGRDMVVTTNCNTCHQVLGGIPGDNPESSGAGFHGGNRNEVRYCVVCHTEQRKYGRTEATGDPDTLTFSGSTYRFYDRAIGNLPNEIHKIHGGGVLAWKKYNYADVEFNEIHYPQDLRNCNKCHDASNPATPQAANWMNVPSRLACGACHDGIDFATGKGVTLADAAKGLTETTTFNGFAHGGFQQPDDSVCVQCHSSQRVDVDTAHIPVTPPNPGNSLLAGGTNSNTNSAWILSNPARKPAGAIVVTYDIKSVSVDANRRPVMVFRMLQDGQPKNLNVFGSTQVNPATGQQEIWDNFMGAPSLYFVFAVPQDGFNTPADFNATVSGYLRTIWNNSATGNGAGTLTGPDGDGYYTGTLTGVTIPTDAVMLTGGMGYSYNVTSTLPLTQTNLEKYPVTAPTASPAPACATSTTNACRAGGLIVIAPNVNKVADGFTGRRPIVEDKRCNACHQELGTFTEDAFHAGQRNDGTTCSWCHTPNRTSSAWSADSVYFVHAIHGGAKRTTEFTWHAATATSSFAEVHYPGILNFCEGCHVPGAYDFRNQASEDALPNRLYRAVATGAFNTVAGQTIKTYSSSCTPGQSTSDETSVHALSPYVAGAAAAPAEPLPNYGTGFSFNAGAIASNGCTPSGTAFSIGSGQTTEDVPAANTSYQTNLVISPITSVCSSCHDSDADLAHFELNGGSFYKARSAALDTVETCIICHGPGRTADIKEVHSH